MLRLQEFLDVSSHILIFKCKVRARVPCGAQVVIHEMSSADLAAGAAEPEPEPAPAVGHLQPTLGEQAVAAAKLLVGLAPRREVDVA